MRIHKNIEIHHSEAQPESVKNRLKAEIYPRADDTHASESDRDRNRNHWPKQLTADMFFLIIIEMKDKRRRSRQNCPPHFYECII